mmetsp:Transcript_10909/g.28698  ORF Transcript_10909/g.28698 Transcript_10909/m.28698 type:complete len:266 (-) Transcript_10909:26-823(-)
MLLPLSSLGLTFALDAPRRWPTGRRARSTRRRQHLLLRPSRASAARSGIGSAVQRHASSRKALHMAARAATVRAAVVLHRPCHALHLRAPLPKLPLVAEMPRRMDGALGQRKEFDASTRVTRACIEVAALPTSQMKRCVEMMYCAPQAKKFCTRKVKVVPKRRAQEWPLRAAAKFPVHTRKITAFVSEVVQGVGIWLARTLVDCREWRCDRLMLVRSCSERDCERHEPKNVSRPLDEMTASSSPSRWTPRRRRGPLATRHADPRE